MSDKDYTDEELREHALNKHKNRLREDGTYDIEVRKNPSEEEIDWYRMSDKDSPGYSAFTDPFSPFYGLNYEVHPDWRPSIDKPVPIFRCSYVKSNDKKCDRTAVRGSGLNGYEPYCRDHAPLGVPYHAQAQAVVEAGKMKLMDAVPKAIDKIINLIDSSETPASVALKASTEILDRSGINAKTEIAVEQTVTVSPSEKLFDRINSLRKTTAEPESVEEIIDAEEINDPAQKPDD